MEQPTQNWSGLEIPYKNIALFLEDMFLVMLPQIEDFKFNIKYLIYKLSFGKLMKNDEEMQFIKLAIEKTKERLDIKNIMERLDDVNKIKKIIFNKE